MIEIIELPKKEEPKEEEKFIRECSKCGCKFSYTKSDIISIVDRNEVLEHINCPYCNHYINLNPPKYFRR